MKFMENRMHTLFLCCVAAQFVIIASAARSDQVLLDDVKVITLHYGQMTKARRSSAVPQLKCVGGTAGCSAFKPQTVQCYNRGSDGYDIQWECKTDMDNAYRFGKLQVSCEGYSYPDDPYILSGSCGLEYTLDLTAEGMEKKNAGSHGNQYQQHDYGESYHDRSHQSYNSYKHKASSIFSDLFTLAIIAVVIYMIYKCVMATPSNPPDGPPPSYDDTFRSQHPPGNQPPPYGFREDYTSGGKQDSCSSGFTRRPTPTAPPFNGTNTGTPTGAAGSTGGGFWSGAFTGGLLGYMFGNRNSTHYGYQRPRTSWWGGNGYGNGGGWGTGWGNGGGWGSGWGNGGGWGSGWGSRTNTNSHRSSGFSTSTSSAPRSTGTRTASGFASTSRR
ncbi:store-operated calcium entry-associated regulatory factor-like [Mya arenaria]|uniref:store-operated calcium entry-associated regulatory factor-like n=1 Tax=Mya arenaria TaxID=6604 RepID=UPI0022E60972|nr:store-operated calcium entry-associated regulatory factor-like [Mya arenaria]